MHETLKACRMPWCVKKLVHVKVFFQVPVQAIVLHCSSGVAAKMHAIKSEE